MGAFVWSFLLAGLLLAFYSLASRSTGAALALGGSSVEVALFAIRGDSSTRRFGEASTSLVMGTVIVTRRQQVSHLRHGHSVEGDDQLRTGGVRPRWYPTA